MLSAWVIVLVVALAFRHLARRSSADHIRKTSEFLSACADVSGTILTLLDAEENKFSSTDVERLVVVTAVMVGLGKPCDDAIQRALKFEKSVSEKEFIAEAKLRIVKAQSRLVALFQAFKMGDAFLN